MLWIASLLGTLAALCFYLSAPQQRLRPRPLGARGRYAGGAAAILALALWIASLDGMAGIFSALTAVMFGGVLLPYVAWLARPAPARDRR
jgi:hypothetical protein